MQIVPCMLLVPLPTKYSTGRKSLPRSQKGSGDISLGQCSVIIWPMIRYYLANDPLLFGQCSVIIWPMIRIILCQGKPKGEQRSMASACLSRQIKKALSGLKESKPDLPSLRIKTCPFCYQFLRKLRKG